MLENAKITPRQLIFIFVIIRLVITVTFFRVFDGPPGNQDVWISRLLSIPVELLLSAPIYLLWKRFPNQSLIEYSQTILGKAGKLIGMIYILYFVHLLAVFFCQWCSFLTTAIMPETPALFFLLSLLFFAAYAVKKGIEVIARLAEFFAPLVLFAVISIFLLLSKDMDFRVFTPFMEQSFFSILAGALVISTRTSEMLTFAMLLPYLNEKKTRLVFISSYSIYAILVALLTVTVLTTLGLDLVRIHQFSYYSVIQSVMVGGFIERIEALHLSVWILSGFLRVAVYLYLIAIGLSQVFNIKSYTFLVIPTITIIVPIALASQRSIVELNEFLSYKVDPWYNLFFILVIPAILLLISITFRKQGDKKV